MRGAGGRAGSRAQHFGQDKTRMRRHGPPSRELRMGRLVYTDVKATGKQAIVTEQFL